MPENRRPIKVACRSCHDRRVKCDRREGVSCSNCRIARRHCEPIISHRGRRRKLPLIPTQNEISRTGDISQHGPPPKPIAPSSHDNHHSAQNNREKEQEPCFPALGSNGKTPYIGDSSNLNYLIQQFGNPFRGTTDIRPIEDRLQGAMLARLGKPTAQEIARIQSYTAERLEQEGAFELPTPETSEDLLNAYFNYSLASLPLIDRPRFFDLAKRGEASHLLLNAVYLAATTYCSDEIIANAGFVSRYVASLTFYRRAKAIYDAGYETDSIATIQATFLICNWWSGLQEPKDPWYWLGISVGMAQALGMHQEKSYMRLDEKDRKTWRKLWWMIYAMDINLSMLLDRPPRVQGRLCNVKPLSEDDFEKVTVSEGTEVLGKTLNDADRFAINAVQLARIVDQFYTIKFDETNGHSQDMCLEQISLWSSSLPDELQNVSTNSSPWAMITNLLYQDREYRLLLHRSNPRFSQHTGQGTPTFEICTQISHILESIVANDLVYPAAASIVAPVLSMLSIHIVNIHRGDPGIKMISENRARFCMVILDKLHNRFPVVASFYPIYEALLKRYAVDFPTRDNNNTRPGGSETGHSVENMADTECTASSTEINPGSFDQFLQDSASGTFSFPLPFGNLFEDILFSSPPPEI